MHRQPALLHHVRVLVTEEPVDAIGVFRARRITVLTNECRQVESDGAVIVRERIAGAAVAQDDPDRVGTGDAAIGSSHGVRHADPGR